MALRDVEQLGRREWRPASVVDAGRDFPVISLRFDGMRGDPLVPGVGDRVEGLPSRAVCWLDAVRSLGECRDMPRLFCVPGRVGLNAPLRGLVGVTLPLKNTHNHAERVKKERETHRQHFNHNSLTSQTAANCGRQRRVSATPLGTVLPLPSS